MKSLFLLLPLICISCGVKKPPTPLYGFPPALDTAAPTPAPSASPR